MRTRVTVVVAGFVAIGLIVLGMVLQRPQAESGPTPSSPSGSRSVPPSATASASPTPSVVPNDATSMTTPSPAEVSPDPQEQTSSEITIQLRGPVELAAENVSEAAIQQAMEIISAAGGSVATTPPAAADSTAAPAAPTSTTADPAPGDGAPAPAPTTTTAQPPTSAPAPDPTAPAPTASAPLPVRLMIGVGPDSPALPEGVAPPAESEGYVLATSVDAEGPTVRVVGTDEDGLHHGLQTLGTLESEGVAPNTVIRDFPRMRTRGIVEGFYGPPWTLQERIDILRWSARHRLNTYMYAPKDDVHLRDQWREPYPKEQLAELRKFADAARANRIRLIATLSPGLDICYSSEEDFQAAVAKFEALREVGFTAFSIALDDINASRMCAEDQKIGGGGSAQERVARAQAHFVNRVQREYLSAKRLPDLVLTPTKYHGAEADPARTALSVNLDDKVAQVWTGDGIVDDEITAEEVKKATTSFHGSKLLLWDNFPVNDGDLDRLFLGPIPKRDAALHQQFEGILVNPMLQAYASMPAIAAYGSYTWYGPKHDADKARLAAVDQLVGVRNQPNVAALMDVVSSWRYSSTTTPSELGTELAAFNDALEAKDADGLAAAEEKLRNRLELLSGAPAVLEKAASKGFAEDLMPWARTAADLADAALEAIEVKKSVANRNPSPAAPALKRMSEARWRAGETVDGVAPTVGDGALQVFVGEAEAAWENATGHTAPEQRSKPRASTNLGQWDAHPVEAAVDGKPGTAWVSRFGPDENSEFLVDLGRERAVTEVKLLQAGTGDTAGDFVHNGVLEVSADGAEWTQLGRINRAEVTLSAPADTRARYVRISASAPNPDGQWVQINEVIVK